MPKPSGYVKCPVCEGDRGLPAMRGMCSTCHREAKRSVDAGITTWMEIEALGLATPVGGEKKKSFIDVLKRKREE